MAEWNDTGGTRGGWKYLSGERDDRGGVFKGAAFGISEQKAAVGYGADEVQTAEYMKLLPEDFAPENVITREQAAAICRKLSI